jgi:hypothetical protein
MSQMQAEARWIRSMCVYWYTSIEAKLVTKPPRWRSRYHVGRALSWHRPQGPQFVEPPIKASYSTTCSLPAVPLYTYSTYVGCGTACNASATPSVTNKPIQHQSFHCGDSFALGIAQDSHRDRAESDGNAYSSPR